MKSLLLILFSFFCAKIYSQDSLRINQINSIVNTIIHSDLPTEQDSTLQDYPGLGLSMKKYITLVTYGKELKKYSQFIKTTKTENSITKQEVAGNAFYYDQNKLIKVEEFLTQDGKENKAEWYFSDDKCFYHTLKSDKAEDRIHLLLDLSNGFIKKVSGQN